MSSFLDDKGLNKFFQAIKAKFDARYLNGPANSLIEQNKKSFLKVWHGTADEFKQVETKESDTAYLVEGESADTEYAPITHAARHAKDGADPIDPVSIGAVPYAGSYDCANDTEIDAALDDMAIKAGGCSTIYGNITVTAIASLLVGAWSIRIHFINLKAIDVIATKTGVSGKPITIRTRTKRAGTWENWKTLSDDSSIAAALEGKAPAGYGLGGAAKTLSAADDLNVIRVTGWYNWSWKSHPKNAPDNTWGIYGCAMHVFSTAPGAYTIQTVYDLSDDVTHGCVIQRTISIISSNNILCYPWEWVNPPLVTGKEYRTTQRVNNKAVYQTYKSDGVIYWRLDGETAEYPKSYYEGGTKNPIPKSVHFYQHHPSIEISSPGWYRILKFNNYQGLLIRFGHGYNYGGPDDILLYANPSQYSPKITILSHGFYDTWPIQNFRLIQDTSNNYFYLEFKYTLTEGSKNTCFWDVLDLAGYITGSDVFEDIPFTKTESLGENEVIRTYADYVNPIIMMNHEIRTGERYCSNQKPVYVKTLKVPKSAITSNVVHYEHGISNFGALVELHCSYNAERIRPIPSSYYGNIEWNSQCIVTTTELMFELGANVLSRIQQYDNGIDVIIKYTKTTGIGEE